MRALFDYEPNDDTLLPCKEIGLPFENGDILQVSKLIDSPCQKQIKKFNL